MPRDRRWFDTGVLTPREYSRVVLASAQEVGPALFLSLLIITVSFLPVFALAGQEGRLFHPLAYTKGFAMAAASLLAVTLVPVAMGWLIRGRLLREGANPINRWLIMAYRPVIHFVLRHRWGVVGGAVVAIMLTWIPWSRLGSEFMPPLDEGTILFMPTTVPGASVARIREVLRIQDETLAGFPEVETVWGKAGRAETATDPAGLDMIETTITLRPRSEWRKGMTAERLMAEMDSAVRIPGVTNAWTMPIKGRIDMLATGIRTPVGIKLFGPDLAELERLGREVEAAVRTVPGTRSAFAERAVSGYYLDIDIDRAAAARHGLNVGDVQAVIATAVGGMTVTQTVEGRERYGVRIRYPQELRDTPERLASVLLPVAHGLGTSRRRAWWHGRDGRWGTADQQRGLRAPRAGSHDPADDGADGGADRRRHSDRLGVRRRGGPRHWQLRGRGAPRRGRDCGASHRIHAGNGAASTSTWSARQRSSGWWYRRRSRSSSSCSISTFGACPRPSSSCCRSPSHSWGDLVSVGSRLRLVGRGSHRVHRVGGGRGGNGGQ